MRRYFLALSKIPLRHQINPKLPFHIQMSLLPSKLTKSCLAAGPGNPAGWHEHPDKVVRWTAQPVLTWVESMAAATESKEAQEGKGRGKIIVNNTSLSTPGAAFSTVPWSQDNDTLRSLGPFPVQSTNRVLNDRTSHHCSMPQTWNLEYMNDHPYPEMYSYLQRIVYLANQIESFPKDSAHEYMRNKYLSIQDWLYVMFNRIVYQSSYENMEEERRALCILYENALCKLQKVLDDGKRACHKEEKLDVVESLSPLPPAIGSGGKKDLSNYMSVWLRNNWTNPYPDEDGLEVMARECGTTPTVVSNWLINARTRKWRPAIVEATKLNRPASMLLDDSICLFEGRSVCDLDDGEGGNDSEDDNDEDDHNQDDGDNDEMIDERFPKRIKSEFSTIPMEGV